MEQPNKNSKKKSETSLPITNENIKQLNKKTTKNKLYSWGFGKYGQIGILDYQYIAEPIEININDAILNITQISCGEFHSSYLTSENKMYVLGKNTFGQLGLEHFHIVYTPTIIEFPLKIIIRRMPEMLKNRWDILVIELLKY